MYVQGSVGQKNRNKSPWKDYNQADVRNRHGQRRKGDKRGVQ